MKTIREIKANCTVKDGHWIWNGAVRKANGKPVIYAPDYTLGGMRVQPGARAAYHCATGKAIPEGKTVMGTCGVDLCVNPACSKRFARAEAGKHVTATGLTRGRLNRIISARVVGRACAKITPEIIEVIRMSPDTGRALAKQFNLSRSTVSRVRRGATPSFQPVGLFSGLGAMS